jgi:hypothetical protein
MTHAENVQMSLERRGRDRAMTENERKRKWYRRNAERLRAQRRREAIEAGGWVCI